MRVAIVGRPNVGKSTLFNRLVGRKLALVDDRPGVTRDRREGEAKLGDIAFTVIDTAGLEDADEESLSGRMRRQTERAIEDADVILFVIDSRLGVTPDDRHFAALARRSDKPVVLVANKAEGRGGEAGAYEAFGLGLGDPIALSAEHGEGMADLYGALAPFADAHAAEREDVEAADIAATRELAEDEEPDEPRLPTARPIRMAVIGRPNAGKSTLINRLIGEDRLLTGPEAGVTRDAISVPFEWRGRKFRIFDTAGLRRKARVQDKLEKMATADGLRAVRFAEVVIVLFDATIPFEKQDLTLVDLVEREGRALIVGLNKWDLVEDQQRTLATLRETAERLLPQVKGLRVVPVSGLAGEGLGRLIETALETHLTWSRRVSTGRLNRFLEAAVERNAPPAVSGRRIKIRYMTQIKARPPHFVLFGNQLDALPESWRRYLVNGLREAFGFAGVPIRLTMRTGDNPFAQGRPKSADRTLSAYRSRRREAKVARSRAKP
jgi:GTP-binding protein